MTEYTIKNAIVDLGFVDGCIRENRPDDLRMLEPLEMALDRLESNTGGNLDEPRLLHDLGFVRGVMWLKPMPGAYSQAMDRLTEFFVEGKVEWYQLPQVWTGREHEDPVLSDDLRTELNQTYIVDGPDAAAEEAEKAGVTEPLFRIIPPEIRHGGAVEIAEPQAEAKPAGQSEKCRPTEKPQVMQEDQKSAGDTSAPPETLQPEPIVERKELLPAPPFNPHNPNGKRGRRVWTDEQRSAAAERAKGQKKPPFDEHFAEVKADFDAGMSPGAIGKKWGCSDGHIRNFLKKHGIDPRRPKITTSAYHPTPRAEYEWTDESRAKLFELLDQSMTWADIGERLDRTPAACRSMHLLLVKEGKAPPKKPPASSAITPEDIAEVQDMLDRDSSYEEIGEWFGCDAEAVRRFCEAHRLIPAHLAEKAKKGYEERQAALANSDRSPASRWKPNPIDPNDWPDIQQMLATGRSREAIASDYDVPVEDLNAFIDDRLKMREPPPGESQPSGPGMADAAA